MKDDFIVTIDTLVYGGSGMSRLPDGKAVFIPFVLPGEVVKVRIIEEQPGFARAGLIEVQQPSINRIKSPCKHFGFCGGCHYQHIPYELQVDYKKQILTEQLQRLGRVEKLTMIETLKSKSEWNYRNSIQFHLSPQGKMGYE